MKFKPLIKRALLSALLVLSTSSLWAAGNYYEGGSGGGLNFITYLSKLFLELNGNQEEHSHLHIYGIFKTQHLDLENLSKGSQIDLFGDQSLEATISAVFFSESSVVIFAFVENPIDGDKELLMIFQDIIDENPVTVEDPL